MSDDWGNHGIATLIMNRGGITIELCMMMLDVMKVGQREGRRPVEATLASTSNSTVSVDEVSSRSTSIVSTV